MCHRTKKTTPVLNADFSVKSGAFLEKENSLHNYLSLNEALAEKPELVVISTPTSLHADHICRALQAGSDVFCEKPGLTNSVEYQKIKILLEQGNNSLYVGFQRFFHPVSLALRAFIESTSRSELKSIDCSVGSYFPNWHVYEDYRILYAGKKSLGGGVLRTECHELALLISCLGQLKVYELEQYQNTGFEIDVESCINLKGFVGETKITAKLNFLTHKEERMITVCTDEGFRRFDYNTNQVSMSPDGQDFYTRQEFIQPDLFEKQMQSIFVGKNYNNNETLNILENLSEIFELSSSSEVKNA